MEYTVSNLYPTGSFLVLKLVPLRDVNSIRDFLDYRLPTDGFKEVVDLVHEVTSP